jgi:ankyrin repeat protein
MSASLPARPSLDWLKKTAKQSLRELRVTHPDAKLAEAQLSLARHHGFSSWRKMKAHIESLQRPNTANSQLDDQQVCQFFADVGGGELDKVRRALLTHPQLINAVGPHPYWGGRPQALHVAVESNRLDMFDYLIAAGADIDGNNDNYWSPLALAIERKHNDMRDVLMSRGAKIGLFEALLLGDDARVEAILRRGHAALPKEDANEGSILAFARTPYAIDHLLELGVSRTKKDRWGATPIEAMSRLGPEGQHLVRHMMSRGFEAEPQEYAHLGDQVALAKLSRANPEIIKSAEVFTGAVGFGHYDLTQWLIEQGADVNCRLEKESGQTALHVAAWNGDMSMVKLLVAAGADIYALDKEHNGTPAKWAEVSAEVTNNPECKVVAEYLRELENKLCVFSPSRSLSRNAGTLSA